MSMNIIVAGGSGFIGRALIHRLAEDDHRVVVLTRNASSASSSFSGRIVAERWDARTLGSWKTIVENADAVVNLVGESIGGKRWSKNQKSILLSSRVDATDVLVEAMRSAKHKPSVFFSASAVGYYGNIEEGDVTEDAKPG